MKNHNEFIRADYLPHKHAKRAYTKGYFIEAIQIIHGCLERQLRELIYIHGARTPHENFDLAYDSMLEIPYNIAVKVLFVQKTISKELRDKLLVINKIRNGVIHKIYYDDSKSNWKGFPKPQYDSAYEDGLRLMDILEEIIHTKVFKPR